MNMNLKHFWTNSFVPGIGFFILFFIEILSFVFQSSLLNNFAISIVGFFLMSFYFIHKRNDINIFFIISYVLLIASDYLYFLNLPEIIAHRLVMYICIFFILFLIGFAIRDFIKIKSKITDWYMLTGIVLISVFFLYIYLYINNLVKDNYFDNNFYFFMFYGFLLYLLLIIVVLNLILLPNNKHINLAFTTICIVVSEIFFCINEYYIKVPIFIIINGLLHFLVYLLLYIYEVFGNKNGYEY